MQWKLDKYLVDETIEYVRRVFTYNSVWDNSGIEIFQLPSGSLKGHIAFEQFFQEREKYPVITVAPSNGTFENLAFNDYMETTDEVGAYIGSQGNKYFTIGAKDLIFEVPVGMLDEYLGGMNLNISTDVTSLGGDDINFNVIEDYGGSDTIVSSGSVRAIYNNGIFESMRVDFEPVVQIQSGSHIKLSSSPTSGYHIMMDEDYSGKYEDELGTEYDGGIVGDMRLPKTMRFGGNYASSIIIRCSVRNDTALLYEMSAIVSQYLMLAKHAVISRLPAAVDGMIQNDVSEFLKKGIHIKSIVKGGIDSRKRSSNDIDVVHTLMLTVNIATEWSQDYPIDVLKGVEIDAVSFADYNT